MILFFLAHFSPTEKFLPICKGINFTLLFVIFSIFATIVGTPCWPNNGMPAFSASALASTWKREPSSRLLIESVVKTKLVCPRNLNFLFVSVSSRQHLPRLQITELRRARYSAHIANYWPGRLTTAFSVPSVFHCRR